jgi:hypothetical protein
MKSFSAAVLLALALMGLAASASESAAAQGPRPAQAVSSQPVSVPEPIWSSVAAAAAIAFLRRRK